MKYFIFTIWIQDDGGDFDRRLRTAVMRMLGRTDHPNHEDLKAHVIQQIKQSGSPDARVEFGPIGESKRQD